MTSARFGVRSPDIRAVDATEAEGVRGKDVTGPTLVAAGKGLRQVPLCLARGLRLLDLSSNPLVSLRNLELAPALEHLVLDGCSLSDVAMAQLPTLPKLHTLSLCKNELRDAESLLRCLRVCAPALAFLALLGNPWCPHALSHPDADEEDYARFRCYVLSWLPKLTFLDSTAVGGAERRAAEQRGRLMRVATPRPQHQQQTPQESLASSPELEGTPLPRSSRAPGDHLSAYGRCRFRYSGKQSEGNRYIRNCDL